MNTPTSPLNSPICPGTPLKKNWLFEPNIYELTPYHRILNDMFCTPRPITFCLGWDVEVLSAIHQAGRRGYTTMIIQYDPILLANYTEMLEIIKYDEFLQEDKNYIEDVKYDLIAQTSGEVVIEDASKKTDLIIDILDMLNKFNSRVKINF